MSYRHHWGFWLNSPRGSWRKASEIEAEPNRRITIHHIIEARKNIDRVWAKYFGSTLHEAFWPELYGKARDRTPPTILCPELYAQPPSDGAKTRNLTQKESRPRGALHRQETPRMSNRFSRGSAQTFADHNPDDPIVVEVVITSFTPVRGASHSATCAAQPPTPPRSTVTPVIASTATSA
jgi:hypothetical protein